MATKSRARPYTKHPLIAVQWLDSHYRPGWTTESAAESAVTCYSVGWLIRDGKESLTLAASITDESCPQRCGEMTIPRVAVIRIDKLT
jgi:hypothetical protein